ncbi:MAG: hypothetical protein ACOX7K_03425 [Oscillospiraceae bacterium]
MQKDTLTTCLASLVLGAFGFFFRWLQLDNAFETETGLAVTGSLWHTTMFLVCLVAVLFFAVAVILMRMRRHPFNRSCTAFAQENVLLFQVIVIMFSLLVAFSGVLILKNAAQHLYPTIHRLLAAAAVVTAISTTVLALRLKTNNPEGKLDIRCLTSAVPVVFSCFWLIISYHENANNPTIWAYAIYILTISGILISFFLLAGYFFEKARPLALLFTAPLTAFFCITSMADAHELGIRLLLIGLAGILLVYTFLVVQVGNAKH